MRFKDGEYLFVAWDRLALENTLVELVDLPHSELEEVLDLIDLPGWFPLCGKFQKECFNAADKFSAVSKIGLDMLWNGASGFPNLVEQLHEGFLQMHPLAKALHIMF